MILSVPGWPDIPFPLANCVCLWTADMGANIWTPTGMVPMTFSRPGEARTWRETPSGWVIDVAAANAPRYFRGGMVFERSEAALDNLCLWSEDQTNGAYVAIGGGAAAASVVPAPEPGKTACIVSGGAAGDGIKQSLVYAAAWYNFQVALRADIPCTVKLSIDGGVTTRDVRVGTKWQVYMTNGWSGAANPKPAVIVGNTAGNNVYCFGWQVQQNMCMLPSGYIPTTNARANIGLEALQVPIASLPGFPTGAAASFTAMGCGLPWGAGWDGFLNITSAFNYPDGFEVSGMPLDIGGIGLINVQKFTLFPAGEVRRDSCGSFGTPCVVLGNKKAGAGNTDLWTGGMQANTGNVAININAASQLFIGGLAWGVSSRQLHGAMYAAAVFTPCLLPGYDTIIAVQNWGLQAAYRLGANKGDIMSAWPGGASGIH